MDNSHYPHFGLNRHLQNYEKRCRIRILKSLYINRIAKELFRCTTLWSCVKNVGLLNYSKSFSIHSKGK